MVNIANYRKLIACAVGLGILYVWRKFGIDVRADAAPITDFVVELLISAGTAISVWAFPNDKKK